MSTKPHGAVGKTIAAGQAAHERLCASSDPIVSGHAKAMGHESPATAILDLAERVKGQRPREPLTITEALMSLRESLERSGMSLGALSDLEDAVRHLQAKPDPTAAIVRFLRADAERIDRGSAAANLGVEGRERCRNKASALRTAAAYIERGDHLAAASVDIYSSFLLTQTTAGVTATLPSPIVRDCLQCSSRGIRPPHCLRGAA